MTQPLKVKEQQKDLTVRSFIEMLVAKTAEIFYSAFKRKIHADKRTVRSAFTYFYSISSAEELHLLIAVALLQDFP